MFLSNEETTAKEQPKQSQTNSHEQGSMNWIDSTENRFVLQPLLGAMARKEERVL